MKKKECPKHEYEQPRCTIYKVEMERFICTSVYPKAPQTTESDWEQGEDVDGGVIDF